MQAQATDGNQTQEELVFTVSCFATSSKIKNNWLIDSDCKNNIALDESIFKVIDRTFTSRIRTGNG